MTSLRRNWAPRPIASTWLAIVSLHFFAILQRSSLAVAGLVAMERFQISAVELAMFTMLQLLVHASLQIPAGLALDRFGSRSALLLGVVLMTSGQCVFAVTEGYAVALTARVLVGSGDALTFICVVRLVSTWFSPQRVSLMTQLTGGIGQAGALLAAIPMALMLAELGWTRAYLLLAATGPLIFLLLLAAVHDAPGRRHVRGAPLSVASVRSRVAVSWAHPGTRLAFWIHFTTPFSANVVSLLWGYPFLVQGEGLSQKEAGMLLMVIVASAIVAGPVLGWLMGVCYYGRSTIATAIVTLIVIAWTGTLAFPGPAPHWLLLLLAIVMGIGSPASMIGFEVSRAFNPPSRIGTASGIVNQAGFCASLIQIMATGLILTLCHPDAGGHYTLDDFRRAMSSQYVLWALGLTQILRYRRRTRKMFSRADVRALTKSPPPDQIPAVSPT